MSNTVPTQSSQNVFQRQSYAANGQQPPRGVWQDNPAPPRARTATPQPASAEKRPARAPGCTQKISVHQRFPPPNEKRCSLILWVKPGVKAELERIAVQEGLSVSATGAAFLEQAIQQDIHTQHGALLETLIQKAIARQMRSYSTRIALLLVRVAFDAGQTRSIVTNILSRQPTVTQPILTQILNGSSNAAKRNITRKTPQLESIIEEIEQWMEHEGEQTHA